VEAEPEETGPMDWHWVQMMELKVELIGEPGLGQLVELQQGQEVLELQQGPQLAQEPPISNTQSAID
jgi:hypothetical protein